MASMKGWTSLLVYVPSTASEIQTAPHTVSIVVQLRRVTKMSVGPVNSGGHDTGRMCVLVGEV